MDLERWAAFVAAVALAAGCGSGGTSAGVASVPTGAVDGGVAGGNADGGIGGGGVNGGGGGGVSGGGGGGSGGPDGGGSGGSGDGGSGGGATSPCSPTPVAIGANFTPVVTDGAWIYGWGTQQIARIPVGGGAPETVVGGIDTSVDYALLVDERYVYWTVERDVGQISPRLFRAAKAGGDQPAFLTTSGLHIAADAEYVYTIVDWMGNGNGLVRVRKSDGSVSDEQIGGGGEVGGVDDRYVYFVAPGSPYPGTASLWRVGKTLDNRPSERVASWPVYNDAGVPPSRFVSDGASLFAWDSGRIVRVDFTGAARTIYDGTPPIGGGNRGGELALDDDTVYWSSDIDYDPPGDTRDHHFVDRVGKDGSGARTLHSGYYAGHGVVVAGDSVYYEEGGALYRQCKR